MPRYLSHLLFVCLFSLLTQSELFAQAGVGSLSGQVTDISGAAISGAKISVTNQQTGISRSTETDSSGYFSVTSLSIGRSEIQVSQAGFADAKQAVLIDPSAKVRQDFQLSVGQNTTAVTVNEAGVQIAHDDASIGTVIENQTILSTPLFARNWDDLIRLVPGVQAQRYTEQSGGTASGRTGSFNIHGIDSQQNNFILDGIDNNTFSANTQELSTQAARPSVDVIGEFKLISNPYTSEYGRSPGAVVDVTTKGGSNEIHGVLWEYFRNRVFDANDFISNRTGQRKPANVTNQFGGNFGAPILKNKLFGFFNYEGTRIRRGVTRLSTVPLPNERAGNFSPAAGAAAGVQYPTLYVPGTRTPLPNNVVPQSSIDPFGQQLLNLFPLPNQRGQRNNYARTGSLLDDTNNYDARADWNANERNLVFGRYTTTSRQRNIPGNYGGIADGTTTSAWGDNTLKSYSAVLGWTHIFGPALVNDFRLGFVRNFAYAQQQPFGLNQASQYVPGVPDNPAVQGGVSQTSFDPFTNIGSPDFLPKSQVPQQWQYTDTMAWTRGSHTFKFGVDVRAPMRNIYQDQASTRGTLQFNGVYTGLAYADALFGAVRQGTLNNVYFVDQRLWMASGFVQDDWKVTPKLTLNVGLRYDFATPVYEGKNQQANFDRTGAGSLVYARDGSLRDRTLVDIQTKNFAPRFGFAYSPTSKTVVRGGYGVYYLLFYRTGSENQLPLNPPYLRQSTLTGSNTQPAFLLRNGFPSNFLDPANINLRNTRVRSIDPSMPTPYVQQWSFGLQQELPFRLVATADYVGTKSTYLPLLRDLNQFTGGQYPNVGTQFPYPNFNYVQHQSGNGNGSYQGLELSVQRRFDSGLSLGASYTRSKSIQTFYDQAFRRGPSDFDVPNRFVANYVFELPFGKNKPWLQTGLPAALLGGWRTSGVYTYSTGRPFTVNLSSLYSNAIDAYGAASAMPNVVGRPQIIGDTNCWFYVAANAACRTAAPGAADAFSLPQVGQYGNAGRNILRGPNATVFDFSLMRDFTIRERTSLQFRWESFNLTNTPMFAQPNSTFNNTAVGTITSLAGDPRVMQFALRLAF